LRTPGVQGLMGRRHPQQHLADFADVLHADAFAGYAELYRGERIVEAACMTHARRKIHDLHAVRPNAVTEEALLRIGALYRIEAQISPMYLKHVSAIWSITAMAMSFS
jgi:hypothetical protein